MTIKEDAIIKLKDLDKLRSAPSLNKNQTNILLKELKKIITKSDWLTIGIMAPTIKKGKVTIRKIEANLRLNQMKFITMPEFDGPIFLKANQKTGEIHARIEYGLGEGILISCHNNDNSIIAITTGPFPLDFFN